MPRVRHVPLPCGFVVSFLFAFAWVGPRAAAEAAAATSMPAPFTAVYGLDWHGITAGFATLRLKSIGPDTYEYSSHDRARGIFRIAFPDPINETSTMRMLDGHVAPLTYREDNGTKHSDSDVQLTFDWSAHRVRGMAAGKSVDQPLQPGTQDPLSVQIELMRDLIAGEAPATFLLFDKTDATEYHYTREGNEHLDTPLGVLDTVIYRSDRPGSDRVLRLWLAPSLGYLPLQAQRRRRGKVEFELHIRELHR